MTTSLPLGPPLTILTFSSPSVTSNSAIPDSSTRSISFFSFRKSMLASFGSGRALRVARGSARRVLSTSQGQPSRIDDNPRNALLLSPLNALDQGPFVVALEDLKACPFAPGHPA